MKLNRQGFTLVELLAALVILALLMAAAVPNVIGMINRNKATSYIEDAKKLAARAEYVMRGDTSIAKPTSSTDYVSFSLGYLDNGEFNDPPNGGAYFANRSYVRVNKVSGAYVYEVQLYECRKVSSTDKESCADGSTGTGINLINVDNLVAEDAISKVKGNTNPSTITGVTRYCATNLSNTDLDAKLTSGEITDMFQAYNCGGGYAKNGNNLVIKDLND